jgi:hypothetical protein
MKPFAIYHEHPDWFRLLFSELDKWGIPYERIQGELKIEIRDNRTVFLKPGEFIKIPSETIHKTSAAARTVNLYFEKNADDTIFID